MCAVCRSNPCLHGCPNEPEPEALYRCLVCQGNIYEGYKFIKDENTDEPICLSCLEDMSTAELLELLEISITTAEKDR